MVRRCCGYGPNIVLGRPWPDRSAECSPRVPPEEASRHYGIVQHIRPMQQISRDAGAVDRVRYCQATADVVEPRHSDLTQIGRNPNAWG